jgi:hypothetical protein
MICKNCEGSLRTDFGYCPQCGAKIVGKRLTFRTFTHLFSKPEAVINGYISGVRKKHLNPISYMGIALTLSGLIVFLIQKYYRSLFDFTGGNTNVNPVFSEKWSDIVFDFNALFFLLYIPVLALPAYLSMNKVRYNLAEHFIAFTYILAQYSIISFPISMAILLISPENYLEHSEPLLILTLLYAIYVMQRLNNYSTGKLIGRSLIFLILSTIALFILIIGVIILLFVFGVFNLKDFAPSPV